MVQTQASNLGYIPLAGGQRMVIASAHAPQPVVRTGIRSRYDQSKTILARTTSLPRHSRTHATRPRFARPRQYACLLYVICPVSDTRLTTSASPSATALQRP